MVLLEVGELFFDAFAFDLVLKLVVLMHCVN